jgi:large subunit ribosomal protein L15
MQLHSLSPRTTNRKGAYVGRGGKRGKTSGRGTKGQSARAGHKIRPEMRDIIKKLPKRRGYGRNRSRTIRTNRIMPAVVNIEALNEAYQAGETINPRSLVARGLVRRAKGRAPFVKILGVGTVTKAFVIQGCAVSETARAAILKAQGSIHD